MVSESFDLRIPAYVPIRGLLTNALFVVIGAALISSAAAYSENWWFGLALIAIFGGVVALYLRPMFAPGEFDLVLDGQGLSVPALFGANRIDWIDVTKLSGFTLKSHGRTVMRAITVWYQRLDGGGETKLTFNYNLLDAEPNEVLAALLKFAPSHVETSGLVGEMNKIPSKRGWNAFGRTQKRRRVTP